MTMALKEKGLVSLNQELYFFILGKKLAKLEFGTSTGRQRMVGWFDAVEKGNALRYGGFDELVINKLDALTLDEGLDCQLKICTAYRLPDGSLSTSVPSGRHSCRDLPPRGTPPVPTGGGGPNRRQNKIKNQVPAFFLARAGVHTIQDRSASVSCRMVAWSRPTSSPAPRFLPPRG